MQRFTLLVSNNVLGALRPFSATAVGKTAVKAQTVKSSTSKGEKSVSGEEGKKTRKSRKGSSGINRTKPSGLEIPLRLSPDLSSFMGINMASRVEVQKKIWDYIKKNNLQNAQNKREILCDPTLKRLLGVDNVNMLKLTGLLNKHFEKAPKA